MLATVLPLSLLALSSVVRAAPFVKRGLNQVIDRCYHDFAYTWDDGPYANSLTITNTFKDAHAKTSFFVNGNNWDCIYDDRQVNNLRAAYEAGHQIAHHTWSHAHLTQLTHAQIDVEIQRLNDAFVKILGVKPKFLRPPYGEINDDVADYLQTKYGLTIVTWSDDSLDSDGEISQEHNYDYYVGLANSWDGTPIMSLSHETVDGSVQALQQGTVAALQGAGIKLLTVAECLDMEPYETVTGYYGSWDPSWTCEGDYTATTPSGPTSTTSASQSCATNYSPNTATTCDAVGAIYGISGAAVQAANSFVNCADIWAGTYLCIPTIGTPTSTSTSTSSTSTSSTTTAAQSCATTYLPTSATTCDAVGAIYGITGAAVQAANSFVNCADIWAYTSLCIPTIGTPTSTSTSTSSTPAPSCVQTYSAVAGDNCDSIGSKFGLTGSAILTANPFLNCADIWAWTPVCIPAGGSSTPSTTTSSSSTSSSAPAPSCVTTYSAVTGDTCSSIGSKYGLTASDIQTANSFLNCGDIWAYTPICIPPGATLQCSVKYYSKAGDNCDSIGAANGATGAQILSWNSYLNCSDIWAGTPISICS